MINRALSPLKNKSYFLFGARGSGKSTFLEQNYREENRLLYDLLDPQVRDELSLYPNRFKEEILSQQHKDKIILVDEIQKVPKLLDLVHQLIFKDKRQFVLTGSSARRLKQQGVNLLAGRAIVYSLFPFSYLELEEQFSLEKALTRGLLPESYFSDSEQEYQEYLRAYCLTYLEKEIQQEQWIRKLDPFRRFLQIAGQSNGKIINRSAIARDVGVDDMTVENYFEILVDTLLGFHLPSFHRSVRKQQRVAPKFYLIDCGIQRALSRTLQIPLKESTSVYGDAFEHFIILEVYKLISYKRLDWEMHYIKTRDNVEIDLVIERPGKPLLMIEIKSKELVHAQDIKALRSLGFDLDPEAEKYLLSQDPLTRDMEGVSCMHWKNGLAAIFEETEN